MRRWTLKYLLIIIIYFLIIPTLLAQTRPGQYTEEAPLGSWNILGPDTAAGLGSGFCRLARITSGEVIYSNPALLTQLPALTFSLSSSFNQTQLFSYWLVNTGVISTRGNLTARAWQLDHLGLSWRVGRWTIGLGVALTENYGRPGLEYRYVYNQVVYNQMQIWQVGHLSGYAISLASRLTQKMSLGASLIYERGYLERSLDEFWTQEEIQLLDYRYQKITGFRVVAGLGYEISNRLSLGLSLSPPYIRKVKGESSLTYITPLTEIETRSQASDRIKRPLIAGFGGKLVITQHLDAYLDILYFGWKRYRFSYFGEDQLRNFGDTVRIGAGLEYRTRFRFLGRTWASPYYLGLAVDSQPDLEVRSTYYLLTFGSGLKNELFGLSFSTALGLESGSGHTLKRHKLAITLDFHPELKKDARKIK
ncbi:MAG: hypothetical protein QHH43_01825 [Candidatus Saccharicenans sp.]|jgi:hypothetical protein|nr:outer membrane protein transport protein [Candidatus Saccharicenans sp.]MDH7574483.1 hypothetical protein [Candidatus Saccharicenans sp.]